MIVVPMLICVIRMLARITVVLGVVVDMTIGTRILAMTVIGSRVGLLRPGFGHSVLLYPVAPMRQR